MGWISSEFSRIICAVRTGSKRPRSSSSLSSAQLKAISWTWNVIVRKENSSQMNNWRVPSQSLLPQTTKLNYGILTVFPFGLRKKPFCPIAGRHFSFLKFNPCLRIDSLMINCCSHENFLHFSPQSSHLCICYYHQDLHLKQFHSGSPHELLHYFNVRLLHTP